jgi:septum formation protein
MKENNANLQIKLILASASKHRVLLLKRIGYVPDKIYPADLDETPLPRELPQILAKRLAREKAIAVSKVFPNDIVLAADTVCCAGRLSLPKAMNAKEAEFCMRKLSGRRHRVYTGVCGIYQGKIISKVGASILKVKRLSENEIDLFVKSGTWYGKAGGYGIQGFMSAFITMVDGSSYSNIVGLPLYETYLILTAFGLQPSLDLLQTQKEIGEGLF